MARAVRTTKRNSARNGSKVEKRRLKERKLHFPNIDDAEFYSEDGGKGWKQVPRTMPHILNLMNGLSKGSPLSSTYFDIWMMAWSESYIAVQSTNDRAFAAGFTGQRAVSTWMAKVRKLDELGFIRLKAGPAGKLYIAILDPHRAVKKLAEEKPAGFDPDIYIAMKLCADEFGITALEDDDEEDEDEDNDAEE
jgi:hypothetical protein